MDACGWNVEKIDATDDSYRYILNLTHQNKQTVLMLYQYYSKTIWAAFSHSRGTTSFTLPVTMLLPHFDPYSNSHSRYGIIVVYMLCYKRHQKYVCYST